MLTTGAWADTLQERISNAADGATITLDADENLTSSLVVPAGAVITLDLNGHNVSASVGGVTIKNNGDLTIKDTSAEQNGRIISTKNVALGAGDNSVTTILSGHFESVEGAVVTGAVVGATITIEDGVFSASDNAVIMGNGSNRAGAANVITVNGGTFNGKIVSPGYIACGIYAPWKDVITVNGGTFNITGGCGVLGRAGSVTINGGEFNCTGNVTGKVGDSRVVVPCAAIVYDSQAGYPAQTEESKIEVPEASTAILKSEVTPVAIVKDSESPAHIEISGGTYSSAIPEECCANGFEPKDNGDGTYGVRDAVYVAKIGENRYETLEAAIAAATSGQKIYLLNDITIEKTILIEKGIEINADGHTITSNVTSKLGTFYVNVPASNFTITNATIDGGNAASMAVCAYRGEAKADLTGTVSVENNNTGNIITLTGCTVKNFTGYPGSYVGAVYAFSTSTVNLNNCTFTGNTTTKSTNGASGADVWAGAAATVHISGGSFGEVFVNANAGDEATITVSEGATIAELAICAFYKDDGSTNIPTVVIDNSTVTTLNTEEGNPIPSNDITIKNDGSIINMPATEVAKILNGRSTIAFATIADAITAATASQTITLLDDAEIASINDWKADVNIDKNSYELYVTTFTLADGATFDIPFEFVAKTATYTRTMPTGTKWGTVCLPFALTSGTPSLYTFGNISNGVLTVNDLTETATAATPLLFYCEDATAEFTSENVTVSMTTPATTGTLIGTYTPATITTGLENIYYINGDKFHQAKASLTVPAYRAYINYTGAGAKPNTLSLFVDNDEATGIGAITADMATATKLYDINGRQLSAPQKGVNIIKLANGKTMKLIIK